jgi:hypothetical protein
MDKLTHLSITNCIKELDSLAKLAYSSKFTYEELADWIEQVGWELANVMQRRRYDSDEFQLKLKTMLLDKKRNDLKVETEKDV